MFSATQQRVLGKMLSNLTKQRVYDIIVLKLHGGNRNEVGIEGHATVLEFGLRCWLKIGEVL